MEKGESQENSRRPEQLFHQKEGLSFHTPWALSGLLRRNGCGPLPGIDAPFVADLRLEYKTLAINDVFAAKTAFLNLFTKH